MRAPTLDEASEGFTNARSFVSRPRGSADPTGTPYRHVNRNPAHKAGQTPHVAIAQMSLLSARQSMTH
jgi:hypothetical protein